jgi:hypothetical protein
MNNYRSNKKYGTKKKQRSLWNMLFPSNNNTTEQKRKQKNIIYNCNKYLINNYDRCHKSKKAKNCSMFKSCKKLFRSRTTGSEPKYNPPLWNNNKYIRKSHNCYIYALDDHNPVTIKNCKEKKNINDCSDLKPQPRKCAILKGISDKRNRKYTCKEVYNSVKLDNKHIKKCSFNDICPSGFYKAALVVDTEHTYHFYRQDLDGTWSHKQGTLPIEQVDASNNMIFAPHLADRNYNKQNKSNGINYTDFCNYFCVPNNSKLDTCAI